MSNDNLNILGQRTALPERPEDAEIECIVWSGSKVCCRFSTTEFTSRCPITGAPDFARLIIDYVPCAKVIESKSLKLFLGSFRNVGVFHERVVDAIGTRLFEEAEPLWMRIGAFFNPRGGIPIDVFWQSGEPPVYVHIPFLDYQPYGMMR